MTHDPPYPAHVPHVPAELRALPRQLALNLAPVDRVVVAFELFLYLRAWMAPTTAEAIYSRGLSGGLLATTCIALALSQGGLMGPGWGRAAVHRAGLLLPMIGAYLGLRRYLPALQPRLLDAPLLALDRALFGETPAVALQQLASPAVVEWFAFFYYGYFFLLGSHLLGTLLFDRGQRAQELLLGLALVTAVGHALYTFVPGLGPCANPALFAEPQLQGGLFWERVQRVVTLAGAQLDIFPSLHTAHPLLILLHARRHRGGLPFKLTWLPLSVATGNIIVATMLLRFHYGVDVVAGALLALVGHRIACAWVGRRTTSGPRGQALDELGNLCRTP